MVTLGDEGWFAPGDGYGDGSYPYGGGEGVDFVKNLAISTLDYVWPTFVCRGRSMTDKLPGYGTPIPRWLGPTDSLGLNLDSAARRR